MAGIKRLPVRATLLTVAGIYVVFLLYGRYVTGSIPRHRVETGGFILGGVALLCSSLVAAALRRERVVLSPPAAVSPPPWRSVLGGYLLALGVSLVLYWPVLFVGYFYDDYIHIRQVLEGELGVGTGQRFRPTSFMLWHLALSTGFTDVGLHFVNIALHAGNAVLTFVVGTRLGFSRRLALIAAALFITFPTSVEAVSWVVALPDLLMTTLCLLFLCLLPGATRPRAALAAATVMVAALCTKETAISIPAIAVAAYAWSPGVRDTRTWLMGTAVLGASIFAMWRIMTPTDFNFLQQPSQYLFQKMTSVSLGALALPWKQAVLESHRAAAFLWSAAVTVVFTLYFIRCTKDTRAAGTVARFGAWIAFSFAPVYTWFFISPDLEGGRYLYLATPAWSMLIVACVASELPATGRRRAVGAVAIVTVTLAAFVFGVQSGVGAWTAAAQVRDDVLAAAESVMDESECQRVVFLRLPESLDGAFIFRNGFRDALYFHGIAREGRPEVSLTDAEPGCRLTWNGERKRFQVQSSH